jgi:hypothetical protein
MDHRLAYMMSRGPRPKTLRCARCKKKMSIQPRGRVRVFCSKTCRQRAYEKRKWSRPTPIEALDHDLATIKVCDIIRTEVLAILQDRGLITDTSPPPTPKAPRKRPPLRVVE